MADYNDETRWPGGFDPEAAGCVLIEGTLLPGESVVTRQFIHAFIVPGTYRFRAGVSWGDERLELISMSFRVSEP